MRRSRNSHGGSGNHNISGGAGPLITEHLMQDIDLELELLKRKREMLEQQQQQQYRQPFNQSRNYNQQSYSYGQNESNRGGSSNYDFSHLYNDGPQQNRKPLFGKKRQSGNDWQRDTIPTKRPVKQAPRGPSFAGTSSNVNQRSFSTPSQLSKTNFKYGQGKQFTGQRVFNQRFVRPENKFVGNKITKPKAFAPPNKMASQSVAERRSLVETAIQSAAAVAVEKLDEEAFRLLADKVPTKQMTGRLELALGAILKDVKDCCAKTPHGGLLKLHNFLRDIKQGIRERIRTAMLGKIVGPANDIIAAYRKMFPKETDIDIVNSAVDTAGFGPKKLTSKDIIDAAAEIQRPPQFYRAMMNKLIQSHLTEMFDKLHEIYSHPEENVESKPEVLTDDNVEKMEPTTEQATENEVETPKTDEAAESEVPSSDAQPEVPATDAQPEVPATDAQPEVPATKADDDFTKLPYAKDYKLMLPGLLKRHIPFIASLLNLNKGYRDMVSEITGIAKAKYLEQQHNNENDLSISAIKTPKKFVPAYNLPYYVKIMGKPLLPKKIEMHSFLEEFNAKSVKKHRTISNLLIVGFSDKKDFDNIAEADGTTLGYSTLSIRICENHKKQDNKNAVNGKSEPSDESAGNITICDIDGQIDDLLSSIRTKEEQTDNDETEANISSQEGINQDIKQDPDETIVAKNNTNGDAENPELAVEDPDPESGNADSDVQIIEDENVQIIEDEQDANTDQANGEKVDLVGDLKNQVSGRATPTRASTRIASTPATPSSIRTRRASRLVQN